MSKQVLRESLPNLKDKKIQIYYPEQTGNSKTELKYNKRYIYSKQTKKNGGLWAYFRQISLKETLAGEKADALVDAQFTINYNRKISSICFVEYYNYRTGKLETYGVVGEPDIYEGYKGDIKLNVKLVKDDREYDAEVYDEQ